MVKEKNLKLYVKRLKLIKKVIQLMELVPFVECYILNGSMSDGTAKQSSDIDFMVVTKKGRIYTARLFVTLLIYLLGYKRSSNQRRKHAGKFCFNYFVTNDNLVIPHNRAKKINCYCAKNYSKSILAWGSRQVFNRYLNQNYLWMKKYLAKSPEISIRNREVRIGQFRNILSIFPVKNSKYLKVKNFLERMLKSNLGNSVESLASKFQIYRITKKSNPKLIPEFIAFNEKELRFHSPKNIK